MVSSQTQVESMIVYLVKRVDFKVLRVRASVICANRDIIKVIRGRDTVYHVCPVDTPPKMRVRSVRAVNREHFKVQPHRRSVINVLKESTPLLRVRPCV